jgi:C4-dicarboxylate-specific signal transduction histidine kinase
MSGSVDDRLLDRWETSRRHQEEARRFLARQRLSDATGEQRALDEIVATMTDLEQTLRERVAARRSAPPAPSPTRPAAC